MQFHGTLQAYKGCWGKRHGISLLYISLLESTLHNSPLIMGARHKHFKDLMLWRENYETPRFSYNTLYHKYLYHLIIKHIILQVRICHSG